MKFKGAIGVIHAIGRRSRPQRQPARTIPRTGSRTTLNSGNHRAVDRCHDLSIARPGSFTGPAFVIG